MRIIYLYQYFVARQGHGMTRAYEFARRLVDAGHDVHVITSPGYLQDEYKHFEQITHVNIEGVPVIIIPVSYSQDMSFPQRIRSFLRFAVLASWVCMVTPVDVVYASSGPLTIALPALAAKLRHRTPMVLEVRDLWPEMPIAIGALKNPIARWLAQTMEWIAYHCSAHVIALSPGMKAGVLRRGIPDERVTVIPNSSNVDLFDVPREQGAAIREKLNLRPNQQLIVYTGSFGLMNGVHYLVDLAAHMRNLNPDCYFLLIGSGSKFEEVRTYAETMGVLGHNVSIWEPLAKVDLPAVLAAATVTTSIFLPIKEMWNNSANKFFDSMAARRPIAINYQGWQAELLSETGAGIVLDDHNTARAAEQLNAFISDPKKLAQGEAAAHRLAYERFHRDKMAAKLFDVLEGVTHT